MRTIVLCALAKKGAGTAALWSIAMGFNEDPENEVHCLIPNGIENKEKWKSAPFDVHYIDSGNRKTFLRKTITFLFYGAKELAAEFEGKEVAYLLFYFPTPWSKMIKRSLKPRKTFVVCHDPIPHKGEAFVNKYFSEKEYKRAENIIVMSKLFKSLVSKRFNIPEKRIYYMPHGLYSNYSDHNIVAEDRYKTNVPIRFLFFGRIEKYKGINLLVDAFVEGNFSEDAMLTIAGQGDISDIQAKIVGTKINVINRFIDDDEVAKLFEQPNTVSVIPYIEATQSGVIATAAEFLTPIISSDAGGLVEQLDDGKVGIIFSSGNKKELIHAMKSFVNQKDLYNDQVKLLENYKEKYKWSNVTKMLISELESNENDEG